MKLRCQYCDGSLEIVPKFIFAKDIIVISECSCCGAGWLTVAGSSAKDLEKLGELVGDMMGMIE